MAISSIFNDVIGPIMRGPSSSHSAAACRIGLLLRDLMHDNIKSVSIDYDPNGSLVTTHESQGTDMGLYGGLMGWKANDERMTDYRSYIEKSGISIHVNYLDYNALHPNNYRISISNEDVTHTFSAISTGGGMIEVQEIDGCQVEMHGDYHELLLFPSNNPASLLDTPLPQGASLISHQSFLEIKSPHQLEKSFLDTMSRRDDIVDLCYLKPVVPILSRPDLEVPFSNCEEMMELGKSKGMDLWELALLYESQRGNISESEVFSMMKSIAGIMKEGIETGLKGTYFEDRILPAQSPGYQDKLRSGSLLDSGMHNLMVMYTTAMMEVKSSMGVFVAAPTAGSCGALPGALFGAAEYLKASDDQIVKALLSAGIMGVFIAQHATFAAEVAGCQAETGAGGSMAAAGLVTLMDGSLDQAVAASSLALQNSLGIVCDPVANRVEAPCLGKNVMAASNALSCANMALADYEHLIPFDEVVQSMNEVGEMMAHELTCTGLGGLAATPASHKIQERLKEKAKYC